MHGALAYHALAFVCLCNFARCIDHQGVIFSSMISEKSWMVIGRVERWSLWVAIPSYIALLTIVFTKAPPRFMMWVLPIALLSGGLWIGIHQGLRPFLTGKANLSFIFYSEPIPGFLAKLLGVVFLFMVERLPHGSAVLVG